MTEANPWASFEAKRQEKGKLPPLKLGDESYEFPASPPAILWYKIAQYEREKGHPMPDAVAALEALPELIGEEEVPRVLRQLDLEELSTLMQDLFKAWGWQTPDNPPPNRQARRASRKTSGKGSARSKRTSSRTTASTSKSSG